MKPKGVLIMKNVIKSSCLILLIMILLSMLGCSSVEPVNTTTPSSSSPEKLEGQITAPSTTATAPAATPTEPSRPAITTSPSGNKDHPQGGNEAQGGPLPTEPPVTAPATTVLTPTAHTHNYTSSVIAATCTTQGYTRHTCSCGHSYDDDHTAADQTAHSYVPYTRQPTCALQGVTYYVCSICGNSYLDENSFTSVPHTPNGGPVQVLEPTIKQGYSIYHCSVCDEDYYSDYLNPTEEHKQAFYKAVVEATIKYVNQFRVEEGTPTASPLPGLTQVAEYRAVQLQTNFAHDTADQREATAYYQYGEYVDFAAAGRPDLVDQNYYACHGREAIYAGSPTGNADDIGYRIASAFRSSSGHWSYVGGADYPYIAVGVHYDPGAMGGRAWKCCILMSDTDQYG